LQHCPQTDVPWHHLNGTHFPSPNRPSELLWFCHSGRRSALFLEIVGKELVECWFIRATELSHRRSMSIMYLAAGSVLWPISFCGRARMSAAAMSVTAIATPKSAIFIDGFVHRLSS